jgi:signal transduction histidine kinase
MPPEDAERIFEPFYTTKPAGEGHGLGLVVAKGIVVDHDGEIQVSSAVGEGTEFRIEFPSESDLP